MEIIKIHTSNKEKVINILNNITISGEFWEYNLRYEFDNKIHKLYNLENEHYFNMPEFEWSPFLFKKYLINVHINNQHEKDILYNALGAKQTKVNYIHYELDKHPFYDYEYSYTHKIYPKYPIYVITKGRWHRMLTIRALESMKIDYYLCVEPTEYQNYAENTDASKILKLPEDFSKREQGSIPVRNFVWEHATSNGYKKHWILDDNIDGFFRWNQNIQKRVKDGVFFRVLEEFSDRYENIGLTGCQYVSFVPAGEPVRPQFTLNTRVYSCILINNELLDTRLEERWRGKYNEDTDLSLRVLHTGDLCTVNFNSMLCAKKTTGTIRGGNTDSIYDRGQDTGYLKKFEELKSKWGDLIIMTRNRHKDGRPHHIIPYTKLFKQPLKLKEGIPKHPKVNEYNMVLTNPNETIVE